MTLVVRDAVESDHAAVLAMNNAATPHVNELTENTLGWIISHADYFRVAEDTGEIEGFVLAMRSGLDYWSLNYRWFSERGGEFLYLDRVVVAGRAHRRGVGSALYEDICHFASGRWPRITLEVNLRPPNPGSLAFHKRMGFAQVGIREEDAGAKAVSLMERAISPSALPADTSDP